MTRLVGLIVKMSASSIISKCRFYSCVVYILLSIPWAILLMYLFPKYQRSFRRLVAKGFLVLFGVKAHTMGDAKDWEENPQILILNHQSFMDVMYLEAMHPKDLCWVAKAELGKPFIYGHALKAPKMILINREDKKELIHLLKVAKERLDEGRVLCIFPEGTRSSGGDKLLPFKSGAKVLVEKYQLCIQPILFCNTRACMDFSSKDFANTPFSIDAKKAYKPDFTDKQWYDKLREQMQQDYTALRNSS